MSIASDGPNSFLGYGLVRPFERGSRDFAVAGGERLVISAMGMIIGTRPGDWRWRPDFGINLEPVRHQNMDEARLALAETTVAGALLLYEPRIRTTRTKAEAGDRATAEETTMRVTVYWDVIDVNNPTNQTLMGPFETTETV